MVDRKAEWRVRLALTSPTVTRGHSKLGRPTTPRVQHLPTLHHHAGRWRGRSTMDDLLDLDWDRMPAASSSALPRSNNGSSYNFEALTRSLPQSQSQPASASRSTPAALPKQRNNNGNSTGSDAFSSLLGFGSGSTAASSNSISMAERLKREQQQRFGSSSRSMTPQQSTTPVESAWDGLDSFLGAPQTKAASAK